LGEFNNNPSKSVYIPQSKANIPTVTPQIIRPETVTPQPFVVKKTSQKLANDCSSINRPKNGYCPPNKPYMSKTANKYDCCYNKPRFQSIKKIKHEMGEKHEKQLINLLKKGILRKSTGKWGLGMSLDKLKNFKIIVYDLETTGRPFGDDLPDISQIAMYCPQTDEFYVSYAKPKKTFDRVASELTGIYETFIFKGGYFSGSQWVYLNPFMRSNHYLVTKEELYPHSSSKMFSDINKINITHESIAGYIMKYGLTNLGLVSERIMAYIANSKKYQEIAEKFPGLDNENLIVQYILFLKSDKPALTSFLMTLPNDIYHMIEEYVYKQKKLSIIKSYNEEQHEEITKIVVEKYGVKSVENELPFDQIIDDVDLFIKKGTDHDTIIFMVAHNGQSFDEPILRDGYKKAHKSFYFTDNILFIDSYLMTLQWIDKASTENFKLGTLYKKFLNEEMPGWHDAKADVTGLWKMIMGLFNEVWNRNDFNFIAVKFLEKFYSSQLIDEYYLRSIAADIFRSKEYEDLGSTNSGAIRQILKQKSYEAPFGGGYRN
jgi:hypothetical protein